MNVVYHLEGNYYKLRANGKLIITGYWGCEILDNGKKDCNGNAKVFLWKSKTSTL